MVCFYLQARLSARRARRLAEARRQAEESAAQQFVDEQARQLKTAVAHKETDDMFKAPEVKYQETPEEQALRREQV